MQVKSIANSAILSTFIKLPFVIKTSVLSSFEWPFYTDFTVHGIIVTPRRDAMGQNDSFGIEISVLILKRGWLELPKY